MTPNPKLLNGVTYNVSFAFQATTDKSFADSQGH